MRCLAENVGEVGTIVVEKVKSLPKGHGLNTATGEYGDMIAMSVTDPAKVTATALRSAASVASLILVTNCSVVRKERDKK